ncbi:2-oxoisovalerate dehydrogenase subunit alpha, mitochondrial-like [Bolinopsis microptera]|uniref:2-oxoisovalerate dehydrogenase subunit alpha, mitochondrial-like n=1 Tax=Bolinopsis microptera TaxID=2820187 RepID=UPI00307A430A
MTLRLVHKLKRSCTRFASSSISHTDERAKFTGSKKTNFTHELKYLNPLEQPAFPTFRVLDNHGNIKTDDAPKLSDEELVKIYRSMALLSKMDKILLQSQRQGRVSFYMTCSGEEAAVVGSAAALQDVDTVFTQYREVGVFLWRGFTLQDVMHQCFSTHKDNTKGRQMPIHYSAKKLNIQCVSSTLATQVPNAVGYAYSNKIKGIKAVTVTYFGEGAASEGDVHAAMNMAAVLRCPTIFICRNNGYAISTSTEDQYAGDGIVVRGYGYGMRSLRVDGNDLFAVHKAVSDARKVALENSCPVLIELMTYRVGHHSTSDDSTAYRSIDEVNYWNKEDSPVGRLGLYLMKRKLWDAEKENSYAKECRKEIMAAFNVAESALKPSPYLVFDDVYDSHSTQIAEQKEHLEEHLKIYGEHYNLKDYDV